jgi:hypothetical protein
MMPLLAGIGPALRGLHFRNTSPPPLSDPPKPFPPHGCRQSPRACPAGQNLCHLVQFDLYSRHIRTKDVTKIEGVLGVAMEVLPDLQALGRNAVHHRPIP